MEPIVLFLQQVTGKISKLIIRPQFLCIASATRLFGDNLFPSAFFVFLKPNVAAEWLPFQLRIREVPGSNIGPDTCYPDRFFVVFLVPSR
jgi:hypothetical protein